MHLNELSRFLWSDTSTKNNDYIHLVQAGWNKTLPDSSYAQYRDMYIIHIIKSGSGIVENNGHRYSLGKNEVFLVRPNQLTVQTANVNDPWELYYFSFKGKLTEEILNNTIFQNGGFYATINDDSIFDIIKNVAIDLSQHPEQKIRSFEYLFKLLGYFDKQNATEVPKKMNSDFGHQKYISAIQEYIQLNYTKQIKISELATQLGLSRSHLYRIFKSCTGKSIEDYVVSVRINTARSLLQDTDLSCTSIAMSVGYSHYTTFFKMFKLNTGYTPQQYRAIAKEQTMKN